MVTKYYYTSPVYLGLVGENHLGQTAVWNEHLGKRFTMAVVYDDDSHSIKFGLATCLPVDNFCKATGRKIAYENALNKPFHVISDFNGKRNDYADHVMEILIAKENNLLKKNYPYLYNQDNIVSEN